MTLQTTPAEVRPGIQPETNGNELESQTRSLLENTAGRAGRMESQRVPHHCPHGTETKTDHLSTNWFLRTTKW